MGLLRRTVSGRFSIHKEDGAGGGEERGEGKNRRETIERTEPNSRTRTTRWSGICAVVFKGRFYLGRLLFVVFAFLVTLFLSYTNTVSAYRFRALTKLPRQPDCRSLITLRMELGRFYSFQNDIWRKRFLFIEHIGVCGTVKTAKKTSREGGWQGIISAASALPRPR